ncbi:DEAD/DEAH box helicase [Pyrenophora tritici-repentis]|nr:DEAD/DEAH box helicase [Pyrenophora tritici-repentis]KAI1663148.1 DEAD/DEAH box helicase [Pyrenophora tritici-repentis]KAI1663570.1 DEAD/DEAH box helicase [Pyrenophora tritici-repentis]
MDALEAIFDHHATLRILVCRTCGFAVPPKHVAAHLQRAHRQCTVPERVAIEAAAKELPNLAKEPKHLCLPRAAKTPIPGLAQGSNGFVCQVEGSHCKEKHNWVNNQRRGGDARKKRMQPSNRLWADQQLYQRLFKAAGWPMYMALEAVVLEPDADDLYARVLAERERIEGEAAATARDTIREGCRQLPDPWVQMTGWLSHLKSRSRADLLAARLPADVTVGSREGEVDPALLRACTAFERQIRLAFDTAQPDIVGRAALEAIERRETGAETNEKPFYANQKSTTVKRYARVLVQILCYVWRMRDHPQCPFTLSPPQRATLLKVVADAESRADKSQLQLSCHLWWHSMLDCRLDDNDHKNGLISAVAVLGLKADHLGGGWYPAHEFSPLLSAIITTSKALVLYSAYAKKNELLATHNEERSVHSIVSIMAEKFMRLSDARGGVTPMDRLLRLRTLARKLANDRNTSGVVAWDGDKILVDRQSFTVADLQGMIKGLLETARKQLFVHVLLLTMDDTGRLRSAGAPLPPLDMMSLVDQPSEQSRHFSFLQHPDNPFGDWRDWLLHRVLHEPALRGVFRAGVRGEDWSDGGVYRYMQHVRRFKEILFALVHLSAGAPARGTEITSILCENDVSGLGNRGIFVESGLVAFVTTYHKGYSFSKRVKTIHRYVPREVSELVVYFLALGRPFINSLQMLHYKVLEVTSFLWEPMPEQALDDSSGSDGESSNEEEVESEGDLGGGREAVSRRRRPTATNPDGFWGTDRVRRVLRKYTQEYLGAALGTRTWRHAYPAIHRERASSHQTQEALDMLYWGKDTATNDAEALQSGHTRHTEERAYGRLLTESPFQTHKERVQFRGVSIDWHRVLGFASAWNGGHTDPRETSAIAHAHEQRALSRWTRLATADLRAELQVLVGDPTATFQGQQEKALAAIVERRLRILIVMATGAGKSLLFQLPAAVARAGLTVVIAPLNALRDDMLARCQRMAIPCAKWEGTRPPYWARVVLVTPESAVTASFGRFLDEKRMMRELDRIVIDECHVLLESSASWRPDILKLTQMTEKGTQVVYLTATLPPAIEPVFLQVAGLDQRSLFVCRDAHTTRRNIAYQVVPYARDALEAAMERLVAQKRAQFGPKAQIIVYGGRINRVQALARQLRCPSFFREMGSEEQKAGHVRAFSRGDIKLCVATSMLGLGLDAPGVRVVIHVSMPFKLHEFVQESGRAGRSGLPSESLVMVEEWRTKTGQVRRAEPRRLDDPSRDFLTGRVCRRIAVDTHMDGREDRRHCDEGEAACDLCAARLTGRKRPAEPSAPSEEGAVTPEAGADARATRRRIERAVSLEQQQLDIQSRHDASRRAVQLKELDDELSDWRGKCALCMAWIQDEAEHLADACPFSPSCHKHLATHVRHLEGIVWSPYTSCVACRVPQGLCARWEERPEGGLFYDRGPDHCQYPGILLKAVAALIYTHSEPFKVWIRPHLVQAGMADRPVTKEKYLQVLGKEAQLGGQKVSKLALFFHDWAAGDVECLSPQPNQFR